MSEKGSKQVNVWHPFLHQSSTCSKHNANTRLEPTVSNFQLIWIINFFSFSDQQFVFCVFQHYLKNQLLKLKSAGRCSKFDSGTISEFSGSVNWPFEHNFRSKGRLFVSPPSSKEPSKTRLGVEINPNDAQLAQNKPKVTKTNRKPTKRRFDNQCSTIC